MGRLSFDYEYSYVLGVNFLVATRKFSLSDRSYFCLAGNLNFFVFHPTGSVSLDGNIALSRISATFFSYFGR